MEVDWNLVLSEAITQALRIMLPVCIALVLKWAGELWLKIKQDHPHVEWAVETAAEIGYAAAEEYFKGVSGEGVSKLDYAVESAQNYLREVYGLKVDLLAVKDAIIKYGVENKLFSWQTPKEMNGTATENPE